MTLPEFEASKFFPSAEGENIFLSNETFPILYLEVW